MEFVNRCYIPPNTDIWENLSVCCDNNVLVLWSKYQLLIFKSNNLDVDPVIIPTKFLIEKVLIHKNHLVCLDYNGNMYILIWEELPTLFSEPLRKDIYACDIAFKEFIVYLQFKENRAYLRMSSFDTKSRLNFLLKVPDEDWKVPIRGSSILVCETIEQKYFTNFMKLFSISELHEEHCLVIISLDKINIYACLFTKSEKRILHVLKLHQSLFKVVSIKIALLDDVCVLLGLSSGSIVKITLTDVTNKPKIYHLNIALHKLSMYEKSIIYSDGLTMWKTDIFSKQNPNFDQFLIRNVRDFCVIGKQIICVTYLNLIYTICIELNESYIKQSDNNSLLEVKLVTDTDSFNALKKIVKENKERVSELDKETTYLTALSLSKRQDVMDSFIKLTASVYDNYTDLEKMETDLTLTGEMNDYYVTQSYFILIKFLVAPIQHKLNKLLSDVLDDIKIHMTVFTAQKVLKTTSIKINERLSRKNFVIALNNCKDRAMSRIKVLVKIIANFPAQYDRTLRQWTILYRKCIQLHSEQFIKTANPVSKVCLKEDDISFDALICKRAEHLFGLQFQFTMINKFSNEWSLYVRLPNNYKDILNKEDYYADHLDPIKRKVFLKKLSSNMERWVEFQIGEANVVLDIENNETTPTPLLKVTCPDINITGDIRNLFSKIIYSAVNVSRKHLVDIKLYTDIKNLQTELENFIRHQSSDQEFVHLFAKFKRTIYCSLPI